MTNFKTCVQAIHYLLSLLGIADKLKIVKLLFLADKFHLIGYGRTITGDSFVAMKNGPVGSMVLDVLNKNIESLCQDEIKYCEDYLEQISQYNYHNKDSNPGYDFLSDSDKDVIKKIAGIFGKKTGFDLVDLTHKYPEWKKFEKQLTEETTKCENINIIDLFSTIPHDPLGIPEDIIKDAKQLYLGISHESAA
jgi:uncharacterized phage-associated protein